VYVTTRYPARRADAEKRQRGQSTHISSNTAVHIVVTVLLRARRNLTKPNREYGAWLMRSGLDRVGEHWKSTTNTLAKEHCA
jgi:hypothetical protein